MTDATVVNLCRQYLQTWDADLLVLLCDRLEEVGFEGPLMADGFLRNLDSIRRWFFNEPVLEKYDVTVAAIASLYGADDL